MFESPLPLYRKEYGGIVVYDVDAIMDSDSSEDSKQQSPKKGKVAENNDQKETEETPSKTTGKEETMRESSSILKVKDLKSISKE